MASKCEATEREISGRRLVVQRMLSPLRSKTPVAFRIHSFSGPRMIVATHDATGRLGVDYRDFRFKTVASAIFGNYFEEWHRSETEVTLRLMRAYLTLFRLDQESRQERELVALHCDPYEPTHAAHWRYKIGPHLHIAVSEAPIPRAHLALNLSEGESVVSSVDSLTSALSAAVILLREEVVQLFL